jgi:hypothetical protein
VKELANYELARASLAKCVKVDEAKDIHDKAEAIRAYAKQRGDHQIETWAAKIKIRATRRIGQLTLSLGKGHGEGKRGKVKLPPSGSLKNEVLEAAGITSQIASRCERIAAIPEEEFEAVLAEKETKEEPVSTKELLALVAKSIRSRLPPKEPEFLEHEQWDAVMKWLAERRESWPEKFRPTFTGFVRRVLDEMERKDADG